MISNLTVYSRNCIFFFQKRRKTVKFRCLELFCEKSILVYILLKIANLGTLGNNDVIVTSYMICLCFLWNGKRSPQTYIMLVKYIKVQGVQCRKSSRECVATTSLVSRVTKNSFQYCHDNYQPTNRSCFSSLYSAGYPAINRLIFLIVSKS